MKLASAALPIVFLFFFPRTSIQGYLRSVSIHTYLCALPPDGNPVRIESLYRLQGWSSARNIKRSFTTEGILMDRNFREEKKNRKTKTMRRRRGGEGKRKKINKNPEKYVIRIYPRHLAKPTAFSRFLSCYKIKKKPPNSYTSPYVYKKVYFMLATVLCTLSNLLKRMCLYKMPKKELVYVTRRVINFVRDGGNISRKIRYRIERIVRWKIVPTDKFNCIVRLIVKCVQ